MSSKLNVVTIVTTPKSEGINSLARTTVATSWTPNTNPWANTVTPPPRTARPRKPPPTSVGWNLPVVSKGFKFSPETQRSHSFRVSYRSKSDERIRRTHDRLGGQVRPNGPGDLSSKVV